MMAGYMWTNGGRPSLSHHQTDFGSAPIVLAASDCRMPSSRRRRRSCAPSESPE
jgi:hypothetical protein